MTVIPLSAAKPISFTGFDVDPIHYIDGAVIYTNERPSLRTFEKVHFVSTTAHLPSDLHLNEDTVKYSGGLYDKDGKFIPESALWRGFGPIATGRKRIPTDEVSFIERDEEVLYLGYLFRHYGHFLIESLARAWAIDELGWTGKVVFHTSPYLNEWQPYQFRILEALGINEGLAEIPKNPSVFARVHVPAEAMRVYTFAYDEYKKPFERLAGKYQYKGSLLEKIYISRAGISTTRPMGELELEDILSTEGFRVVRPECYSIEEQIMYFNCARSYVGCLGSAMHNLLFSMQNPNVTLLCRNRVINPTFLLVDAIKKIKTNYLRCSTTVDREYFNAGPWHIDFDRVLKNLRDIGLVNRTSVSISVRNNVERDYKIEWYSKRISASLAEKNVDEALATAEEAIAFAPEHAPFECLRGQCLQAQKSYETALIAFELALEKDSSLTEAQLGKARIFVALGRFFEAETAFESVESRGELDADYYIDFARVLLENGSLERALGEVESALSISPNNWNIHVLQSDIRRRMAAENLHQAIISIDNAISRRPYNMKFYKTKADLLRQLGQVADAEIVLKKGNNIVRLTGKYRGKRNTNGMGDGGNK